MRRLAPVAPTIWRSPDFRNIPYRGEISPHVAKYLRREGPRRARVAKYLPTSQSDNRDNLASSKVRNGRTVNSTRVPRIYENEANSQGRYLQRPRRTTRVPRLTTFRLHGPILTTFRLGFLDLRRTEAPGPSAKRAFRRRPVDERASAFANV